MVHSLRKNDGRMRLVAFLHASHNRLFHHDFDSIHIVVITFFNMHRFLKTYFKYQGKHIFYCSFCILKLGSQLLHGLASKHGYRFLRVGSGVLTARNVP